MLWTLVLMLVALWLIGVSSAYTAGWRDGKNGRERRVQFRNTCHKEL